MIEIRSLGRTGSDTIFRAFGAAFAEYEMQLTKEQLKAMLKRRGFDPALSFAAFDREEITAFTLNATGYFNGIPTAYDTGTGTLKQYRGKGLATRIFEHSIPYLQEAGIRQYLLEVLQHNTKAVSVYRNLGFEVTREFNYFRQGNKEIVNQSRAPGRFSLERLDTDKLDSLPDFGDFLPSWQNNRESVKRSPGDFISVGAYDGGQLAGYCIFEPASGDVTYLAVEKGHRRKGIASILLRQMLAENLNDSVKVINTDISCSSVTAFLAAKNIPIAGKQFEMVKKI